MSAISDMKVEDVVEYVANMKVGDLHTLIDALKLRLKVSDMPMFAAGAMMPAANAAAAEPVQEKVDFDVIIRSKGESPNKVQMIKVIKDTDKAMSLAAARDMVEKALSDATPDSPFVVKTLPKEEAKKLAESLKQCGADADIR